MPRSADRVAVSLPRELEDFIPEVEEFYRSQHNGRRLQWHHHWSNGVLMFTNDQGRFELEVTTFQMAVLFCWNDRPNDQITYENIRLATELPDVELRKTLWVRKSYRLSSNDRWSDFDEANGCHCLCYIWLKFHRNRSGSFWDTAQPIFVSNVAWLLSVG